MWHVPLWIAENPGLSLFTTKKHRFWCRFTSHHQNSMMSMLVEQKWELEGYSCLAVRAIISRLTSLNAFRASMISATYSASSPLWMSHNELMCRIDPSASASKLPQSWYVLHVCVAFLPMTLSSTLYKKHLIMSLIPTILTLGHFSNQIILSQVRTR